MAIKTDAMIAHNGADGYTLHVDYDPATEAFDAKAVFNDGTEKSISGEMGSGRDIDLLISRDITYIETDARIVGQYAFRGCRYLETAIIKQATEIATYAIGSCQALKYVYISASCTAMNATAFGNTTQADLVIDCGFSADSPAAASAPWGATGATINYDVAEPNPPVGLSLVPNPELIQNIDLEPVEDIQPVEPEPVEVKKTTKRSAK